jgi:hypothetical protein
MLDDILDIQEVTIKCNRPLITFTVFRVQKILPRMCSVISVKCVILKNVHIKAFVFCFRFVKSSSCPISC